MKLQLPADRADRRLAAIQHATFQKALPQNWHVDAQGNVRAQSILWLFCWAKTGMNSEQVAHEVQHLMEQLFGQPYAWWEARIPHAYARSKRRASGSIEGEFARLLAARP